jgi:DNA polymerase-3 subunit epsilon
VTAVASGTDGDGGVAGAVSDADVRVIRRMRTMDRRNVEGERLGVFRGVALDVETTGLNPARDAIVELAAQRFYADAAGRIVATGRPRSWLEDPGVPIPPAITMITGIACGDVRGRSIFEPEAVSLIGGADFVVSHNASFDRPFVERRLPELAGKAWVCSMRDVDWRLHGFEGRTLGWLLTQMGWFHDAHRAGSDVTALLHLLDHPIGRERTVLKAAVEAAARPTWRIEAVGAPFRAREGLKERGYRWDPARRVWWCEVVDDDLDDEIAWTVGHAYGGRGRPSFRKVTWNERYAAL